jgi:LAO/AO transport system kinase
MRHRAAREQDGSFEAERARQQVYWMWRAIEAGLLERFVGDARVAGRREDLEAAVRRGEVSPDHAAAELLGLVE